MPERKTLNEDLFHRGSSANLPRLHTCENKVPFWDFSQFAVTICSITDIEHSLFMNIAKQIIYIYIYIYIYILLRTRVLSECVNGIFHARSADKPTIFIILEHKIFQNELPNIILRMNHQICLNPVK